MNHIAQYKIIAANSPHYDAILQLFTSPEKLYLIYPAGTWPFDRSQLSQLSKARSDFTVVLDQEQVIGFANLYRNLSSDKFFIGNVVISDTYRGQGIGKQLIRHMCDIIFNRYASEVHISVFNINTAALLLYASLGFKHYDIEQCSLPNGNVTALIHMHLGARS